MEGQGVGGGLIQEVNYVPSKTDGSLIYLNGGEDLNVMLARVKPASGTILQVKTQISPEIGYMALFLDTEGNRMALHSPQ